MKHKKQEAPDPDRFCVSCDEPETDPKGPCNWCDKCSICCTCGTFEDAAPLEEA